VKTLKKKAIRAAAYARYSSDNQREESITAQIKAIKEYCKGKGYVLVKEYKDEAQSATTDNRDDFQKMIDESSLGIFDVVIVHKLDRFARNRYDSSFYKRKLKLNNVTIESVLEHLDDSPESVILESVLEGMAEYYSKNLSREVMKGLNENAGAAVHNGGRPPYGLKVNSTNRKYEIDETRFKAVQMYFEGVDKDVPLAEIARRINAAGFRTYTGDEFKVTSFDTWGSNRKYKGDYTWNVSSSKKENGKRNSHLKKPEDEQTIIRGAIPAIIQDDLWERVNLKLKARAKNSEKAKLRAKRVYLLSGKIFCGKCGKLYAGESYVSRGREYAYYKCSGKCGNKNVDKSVIEQAAAEQLVKYCFTDEAMKEVASRVSELYRERRKNVKSEIEPIKKEIQALDSKINNWIDAIGEGLLDKNILAKKIKESNEKKAFLESQLLQAEMIESTNELDESKILKVLNEQKNLLFSPNDEEKKQVFQEFVESVYVTHNEKGQVDIKENVRVTNGGGEVLLSATLTFIL
jgi:site-specific DNA recombinase